VNAAAIAKNSHRATRDWRVSALSAQRLIVHVAIDGQIGHLEPFQRCNGRGAALRRHDGHSDGVVMLLNQLFVDFQHAGADQLKRRDINSGTDDFLA
jgi:hypothetical protein